MVCLCNFSILSRRDTSELTGQINKNKVQAARIAIRRSINFLLSGKPCIEVSECVTRAHCSLRLDGIRVNLQGF